MFTSKAEQAARALEAGALEDAARLFDEAAREAPDDYGVIRGALMLCVQLKQLDKADALAARLVDLAPHEPEGYLLHGNSKLMAGDFSAAQTIYGNALAATAGCIELLRGMGNAALQGGQPDTAQRHFHAALRMASHDPQSYYDMGRLRQAQERSFDAAPLYSRALALAPKHVPTLVAIDEPANSEGQWERARTVFEIAHRKAPGEPHIMALLGNTFLATRTIGRGSRHAAAGPGHRTAALRHRLYSRRFGTTRRQLRGGASALERRRAGRSAVSYQPLSLQPDPPHPRRFRRGLR
ncbi:MAG: tetratricopeptide repeat protein [Gammaproteobacteria bacterium]|nr:tetratricopeptide repeat protein [Gammaproteobacteria bacterium]